MSILTETTWISDTVTPSSLAELQELVRSAHDTRTPLYPIGGGTSLDFGLTPTRAGTAVSLGQLHRVVDYPARDMVISVQTGITLAELASHLAAEGQRLPIDIPDPHAATLGGAIATNTSGPRRYGQGTLRDYVIGIEAVDGRGIAFHGGGRVVKNVAGYDFCKLLTGSLGTLGIITQVHLKVKPQAETSAFLGHDLARWDDAQRLLAALPHSPTTPTAIELLSGPAWRQCAALPPAAPGTTARLLVGLEGTTPEVRWMLDRLRDEWREQSATRPFDLQAESATQVWNALTAFPRHGLPADGAGGACAIALRLNVVPSAVTHMATLLHEFDPQADIQAHAGNGILVARLARFARDDVTRFLVRQLQPACATAHGNVVVLSAAASVGDLTRQAAWGLAADDGGMMRRLKDQFDPRDILNPGRFVY